MTCRSWREVRAEAIAAGRLDAGRAESALKQAHSLAARHKPQAGR